MHAESLQIARKALIYSGSKTYIQLRYVLALECTSLLNAHYSRTSALASTAAVMAHCIELILIFALCSAVGTIVALLYRLRICESCLGLPAKE